MGSNFRGGIRGGDEALQALSEDGAENNSHAENSLEDIDAYLDLVLSGEHLLEEVKALATAWKGAIDFQVQQGSGELAKGALGSERFLPILVKLVFGGERVS